MLTRIKTTITNQAASNYNYFVPETIRNKINTVTNFTVTTCSQLKSASNYLFGQIDYKVVAKNTVSTLQGASIMANPKIISVLAESEDLRYGLPKIISANLVFYLGKILVFHATQVAMNATIPGYQDSYPEIYLPGFMLVANCAQMYVNNILYNIFINKAVEKVYSNKSQFKGCNHIDDRKGKAAAERAIYDGGQMVQAYILERSLPIAGPIVAPFFRMKSYGEQLFGYNFSDFCTEDSIKEMQKYFWITFGIGAGFWVIVNASTYAVCYGPRIINFATNLFLGTSYIPDVFNITNTTTQWFVYDAMFNAIYPINLIATRLMQKPTESEKLSPDVFRPSRRLVKSTLEDLTNYVRDTIMGAEENRIDWIKIKNGMQHFPPFELAMKMMLPDHFRSIRQYMKTDPAQKLLKVAENDVREQIITAQNAQGSWLTYFGGAFLSGLTQAQITKLLNENLQEKIESTQQKLEVVYSDFMKGTFFKDILNFLDEAHKKEDNLKTIKKEEGGREIVISRYKPNPKKTLNQYAIRREDFPPDEKQLEKNTLVVADYKKEEEGFSPPPKPLPPPPIQKEHFDFQDSDDEKEQPSKREALVKNWVDVKPSKPVAVSREVPASKNGVFGETVRNRIEADELKKQSTLTQRKNPTLKGFNNN